ncbi:MAG: cytochrome c oxidase assembly protein [Betaproteobacteria bacterium]|nr:cytochrome c oxidase assembly protein [Betaproteobacteria bacterium]
MSAPAPINSRKTFIWLALFSTLMFGFGYALVPLYSVFCSLSGLNQVNLTDAPTNTQVDTSRSVDVEFDANVHDMPWKFRPLQSHMTVHPGEISQAEFEVVNTRNEAVTGQAIPSYGPPLAGEFFKKLSCFCFEKQTLAAGERRRMPVVFVVDPALPRDVGTITLSYTFFEVEGNKRSASKAAQVGS